LKSIDEFKLFDEVLMFMEKQNKDIYSFLIKSLPSTKLNHLYTIRSFKKLNVDNETKVRKVVKIKK
jgi:hypothetical protein